MAFTGKSLTKCQRWLQNSTNFFGILMGATRFHVDLEKQRTNSSPLITAYVMALNVGTLISLPFLFYNAIAYVASEYNKPLLTLTDTLNMCTVIGMAALTIIFRRPRELANNEIFKEIFALDQLYFCELFLDSKFEQQYDCSVLLVKMFTTIFQATWPLVGTLQAVQKIDVASTLISFHLTFTVAMAYAVLYLYFLQMWALRQRLYLLNANLESLLLSLEQMHVHSVDTLQHNSSRLQHRFAAAAAVAKLEEISKVHGRLTKLLLRLNDNYKLQLIAVLLFYIINSISYSYFFFLLMDDGLELRKSTFLLFTNYVSALLAFVDVNLIFWMSDSTACSYQRTAHIVQCFQVLPLVDHKLEQQCEQFALQLLQQQVSIRVAGMFALNRHTSLAMTAFALRHTLILVQFEYEMRLLDSQTSITIDAFVNYFSRKCKELASVRTKKF